MMSLLRGPKVPGAAIAVVKIKLGCEQEITPKRLQNVLPRAYGVRITYLDRFVSGCFSCERKANDESNAEALARNKERSLDYARDDNEKQKRTIQQ